MSETEVLGETDFLSKLSPEQAEVVHSWGQGLAVMAGAGSGKTSTLVVKCQELLRLRPESKFAAVSFTERSASDLRIKLSERLRDQGGLSGHWVMTIHGLCASIIREYPREAGFDGDESMLSEPEAGTLWERAIEGLWFEKLTPELQSALDLLWGRESRDNLIALLKRIKDLYLFGIMEHLKNSEDASSRALQLLGAFVLERYQRAKRRRGALDFNDLEQGADRALEHDHVRRAFRTRFDLVMVDEFQDTNPLQANILQRFAREDASNLCVVGDPKQSIYRFRDADVTVFEDFCSQMPRNMALTWNFRSRPGIIDFSNAVCAPAFDSSEMRYDPLVPKREALLEGPLSEPVIRLEVESPAGLATWLNDQIRAGVPIHDFALLMRKIRGNERWLKALSAAGIPIAVGSGGLFWEDSRVREMVAFLKWWDHPGNGLSGAVFLRAPWVGIMDDELDAWVRQDPTWLNPFFSSSHPIAAALAPFRGRVVKPSELLMALLVNESVEAELGAPWLGLWHRLEELSTRGMDFHAAVADVVAAVQDSRRERDVPPPRNLGQLQVLTLHGSKGLEFPHVILVDFALKPARAQDAPLLFWDRTQGAFLGVRDSDGERDKDHPIESQWRADESRKSVAESKRLFYVALTRARERLILVCPVPLPEPLLIAEIAPAKSRAKPKKEVSPFEKDHWLGWLDACGASLPILRGRELGSSFEPAPEAKAASVRLVDSAIPLTAAAATQLTTNISSEGAKARTLRAKTVFKRSRHSVTEWTTLSRCPRAYEWKYIRPVAVVEGEPELGLFTGAKIISYQEQELTQRELGTRVHACLERADFEGLKRIEAEAGASRFLAEPVISWAMSSKFMAPAQKIDPNAERREIWAELSFEVPAGKEILVGSLDRLVRVKQPDGWRYSIVDFKVTEKLKSVEALLEAYQRQLELYTWALNRIEPDSIGRTDAVLINISSRTVQEVPIPLSNIEALAPLDERIQATALQAARIVAGEVGPPRPGPLCRVCEFRPQCPESRSLG